MTNQQERRRQQYYSRGADTKNGIKYLLNNIYENRDLIIFIHNRNFVVGTKKNYLSDKLGLAIALLFNSADVHLVIITILGFTTEALRNVRAEYNEKNVLSRSDRLLLHRVHG